MKPLSVNDALDQGNLLNDCCVDVEGLLTYEFEKVSLNHWPKAEQRVGNGLWLDEEGVFAFDEEVMLRWSGKRVIVWGILQFAPPQKADGWEMGFGHMGLWPARLKVRRIDLLKRRNREHS